MTGYPSSTVPTLPRKELREYYGDPCQGAGDHSTVNPTSPRGQTSFLRRRESTVGGLVPRLRGEDGLQRDLGDHSTVNPTSPRGQASFLRRRESTVGGLVPRLRGEDGLQRDLGDHSTVNPTSPRGQASFLRRRESTVGGLVPRLRGEDGLQRDLDVRADFAQALGVLPIGVGLGFHRRTIGFPCRFVPFHVIQLWRRGGIIGYLCSFRLV